MRRCLHIIAVTVFIFPIAIYGQERLKMEKVFSISSTSASFTSDGGTTTFTITSSDSWTVSTGTLSWGHLTKNGNMLKLIVDANTEPTSRSDSFVLSSGDRTIRVTITQAADISLSVSAENLSFDSSGGTKSITVSTNGSWEIGTGTASWGHLTQKDDKLIVKVDAHRGSSSRTDWFSVRAGNKEKRINISQSASASSGSSTTLSLSSSKLNFSASGGTQTITVTTNSEWKIGTNTASWGHLSKNGNQLSVRIDSYSGTAERTDWFTIKAGNKEIRVDITQSANSNPTTTLSVSSSKLNFSASGGTQTITVTTNSEWKIGTNTASWGHLSKNGNQLSVRIDSHSGTAERTDWFTIKADNKEIRVDITQSANSSPTTTLSVSSSKLNFSASGGTQTITVTADSEWQIGLNTASWGHLSKNGNQLSVRIDAHNGTAERADWFTIKAGNKEQRVDITQRGRSSSSYSERVKPYSDPWFRIGVDVSMDIFSKSNNNSYTYSNYDTYYDYYDYCVNNSYYSTFNDPDHQICFAAGLRARIGRPDHYLNLIGGARYVFAGDNSGIMIPVILNFNLLMGDSISIYLGGGYEFAATGAYKSDAIIQTGMCGDYADLQVYYKPASNAIGVGFTLYF